MSHQNTATPQINSQPAPIVLTIPTQNESQSEKQHILKVFPKKTILTFSIIQLTCAGLAAILQLCLIGMHDSYYFSTSYIGAGLWTGFFFGISGGVGLVAVQRPSNCTLVAYMVLSIVSALFALPLIVFAGIGFGDSRRGRSRNFLALIFYGIQLLIGLLQGVVAITTAAFSCRAVCCGRKSHPGAVIFTSGNAAGEQNFTTIPLNQIVPSPQQPATSVDTEEEKPPSYDTAAAKQPEDGDKYQRFD
jgi:hypothetical protein